MIFKSKETWTQDSIDLELWHGENGLIINTAALDERETYYEVERVYTVEPYLNIREYPSVQC